VDGCPGGDDFPLSREKHVVVAPGDRAMAGKPALVIIEVLRY
jgi:hypothetical protein